MAYLDTKLKLLRLRRRRTDPSRLQININNKYNIDNHSVFQHFTSRISRGEEKCRIQTRNRSLTTELAHFKNFLILTYLWERKGPLTILFSSSSSFSFSSSLDLLLWVKDRTDGQRGDTSKDGTDPDLVLWRERLKHIKPDKLALKTCNCILYR